MLQVVVSIAAVAIGAYFAPALAGTLGISQGLAQGIIGLGVTVLGSLLINALIPPVKSSDKDKATFFISGWRNAFEPDGVIPEVYGQMRFAPHLPRRAIPRSSATCSTSGRCSLSAMAAIMASRCPASGSATTLCLTSTR